MTPEKLASSQQAFARLLQIMDDLREKCPWDKKQTFQSLRHLTIEETYELADAILKEDLNEIKKECGDILLHIVFYAKLGSEVEAFDIESMIHALCEKLISRHPHIYGDVKVENEEDVKQNWEKLKLKEGNKSVLGGVPVSLPAMVKAVRIQDKASQVGFDWENKEQVWAKVEEELQEFKTAASPEEAEAELGDLFFALVNYARFQKANPEDALEKTNRKFIRRFQYVEERARETGKDLDSFSLAEMDVWWEEAKKKGL